VGLEEDPLIYCAEAVCAHIMTKANDATTQSDDQERLRTQSLRVRKKALCLGIRFFTTAEKVFAPISQVPEAKMPDWSTSEIIKKWHRRKFAF
jgi:hypothetical protein